MYGQIRYQFAVTASGISQCSSVSPGINEVRGAHDDEQQSARPGAGHETCAAGRVSREDARRNVRPDAPNKNYTIN